MKIPFVDLYSQYLSIKPSIDLAINTVLEETSFIGGKHVENFERNFSKLYNVKHVISCANGTDSLYIIMKMLGIGAGHEVITVANSWISSSETISQTGAKPVFIDIDPAFYSMDTKLLEKSISSKTKAIIVVHLHGQMCDIEAIESICNRYGIFLIEDCAQSHFSRSNGRLAGTIGIAGSFSFYPGKNLGAYGDAGCIITNDDTLAEKCRMFSRHGALIKHSHQIEGVNSRLDGIQAAILSAKLPHILEWTKKRQQVALWYTALLKDNESIKTPKIRPNTEHTFHLYVVLVTKREFLIQFLKKHGIETAIHYPTPLPFMKAYDYLGHKYEDFPEVHKISESILSLPIYPEMTYDMVAYVVLRIKEFYNNYE
jgi:dTDP-4-amino-4,6-dideoxygalactose transaminase